MTRYSDKTRSLLLGHMSLLVLAFVVSFVCLALKCSAANTYKEAVKEYNSGHFSRAVSSFNALKEKFPTNTLVHYYLALSEQAMMHVAKAKSEYEWVAENGDENMKQQAINGLGVLQAMDPTAASTTSGAPAGPRVKKVIEFYADWCPPCRKFAPILNETAKQYEDILFIRNNVDDPRTQTVAKKYLPPSTAIPVTVFLDGTGHVLLVRGAWRSIDEFTRQITAIH